MFEKICDDIIALLLILVIVPLLWALHGAQIIILPDTVLGATVSGWTGIITYYVMKKINGNDKPAG